MELATTSNVEILIENGDCSKVSSTVVWKDFFLKLLKESWKINVTLGSFIVKPNGTALYLRFWFLLQAPNRVSSLEKAEKIS